MQNLSNISVIKDILSRHGFEFSKGLGQNFIINSGICPKMAEMSYADENHGIIEIGTGIGVLTAELAKRAKKVVCIEIDNRLLPILDETLAEFDNIKIINQDVLKVDIKKLITDEFEGMNVSVCANLPYYITSPILMMLLESKLPIDAITVMVQKEAAKRICATEGTRDIGAISMAVRYYSEPKLLFNVSRGSFMPAPDVDSAVIRLDIRKSPAVSVSDEDKFFKLIRGSFGQRRKTLANSLSSTLKLDKADIYEALEKANIKQTARPEELTLLQFRDIFENLSNKF
ncbi:MAG: 16S rRNA (adenine(1518)-N(6)/adenine(1519)-N(6))-dimethyltransferase RsmA [Oscillospiraceae bacterium]|nr:16S rRNA (adenine(1518)-N(6)/adenine(1519)-N(6))-dimethyltransferase RsmA [Oscillospiraceae bacterium]